MDVLAVIIVLKFHGFYLKEYATPNDVCSMVLVKLITLTPTCRFKYASLPRNNRGLHDLYRPHSRPLHSMLDLFGHKPEMTS